MIELTEQRRRALRRTAYVVAPALLATLAVLHPGAAVSQVDLNDGTVWLTSSAQLQLGRYNPAIEELNAGLIAQSQPFDVKQDGMDVLLIEKGRVAVIDPASVTLGATAEVPYGAEVSMAGGTTAVSRPTDGAVFAAPTQAIGGLQIKDGKPAVALGKGGTAVVDRDGDVLAVAPDGAIHRLDVGADSATDHDAGHLAAAPRGEITGITAVGGQVAVLAAGHLLTRDADVDLSSYGDELVLQQAGPDADSVLVASTTALLEVPMDGGSPRELTSGASGRPAAPVRVAGCAHAAWASPVGGYLMACPGADPQVENLTSLASSDTLVFRVNRDVVVLNDAVGGRVWLPMKDPEVREPNWTDIEEKPDNTDDVQPDDAEPSPRDVDAECSGQANAPSAEDDEYGVRAGRTALLTPIENDASSSCGVLVITQVEDFDPAFGTLEPVLGGRALQLTPDPAASGGTSFRYTVSDGRGDTATATAEVRVTITPDGVNGAPTQPRAGSTVVDLGGVATYDVLGDFHDPDGDPLVLLDAVAQAGGTARARGDGQVRFQSDGATLGRQTILLTVSDGTETMTGQMFVDVRPAGSLPPVLDPLHAVAYVDEPVDVDLMAAVRSRGRSVPRVAGVDEVVGVTMAADLAAGTVTVTSGTPGTSFLRFTVVAGAQQAQGVVRLDVKERPTSPTPPVPVMDMALLPPGGETTIDPLANDADSTGGILVLQGVDVPAESGLRAAVLDHRLLQVSAGQTLTGPVTLHYTVSNGTASATGSVIVQPVPPSGAQQAPVVPDVEATVRTGGVVTIPVLANAYDPDGDPLTLERELTGAPGPGQGLMFVSGDVLRYQAPDTPTDVTVTFTVSDPALNKTSATVKVAVHASDPESKAPPHPTALTARVYSGEEVEIPVPLTGIDVDGDGVLLLGADQVPTKGRVRLVDATTLAYEAFPGESGTDTFSYAVEDWTGRRAVATVRVGIAERPSGAAQVITHDDAVSVRPGQTVDVLVLDNDIDTGGGSLTLDPALEKDASIEASVDGPRVSVHTKDPGLLQILYTARNERGGQDTGLLEVTVDPNATILPPVAKDVVVPPVDTLNATSVEVDVLAKAENPSGPVTDLQADVDASVADVAAVTPDGRIRVTLVDHAQTLPFLIRNTAKDAEGLSSYAFISVPALGDFPPTLRPDVDDLTVLSGTTLSIKLEERVRVAPGRTAVVDDWSSVTATKSDGSPLITDPEHLQFTPEPNYAGPASISARVSDGPLGDPTTHTRTLTFPITVLATEEVPPTFTPSVLDVGPGDTARVDLRVFTGTPVATADGTVDYTYAVTGTPPGFVVDLKGTDLVVTAGDTVPRGTVGGIPLTIDYGGDKPMPAQVDVRVVASTRPKARVQTHTIADGVEGQPVTVPVLDGAFNPFPTPLKVTSAVVETPASGTADLAGDRVTVRPDKGFIGQMITRYTVEDATGDADRVVEGRIVVSVRGVPEAPTTPVVKEVGDRTVRLEWAAPVANGAEIDSYRVTAAGAGVVGQCAAVTVCTVTGLTNDTPYRFTVAAHNAVGWSEESPASAEARPDVVPQKPAPPTLTRGDGRLGVSWAPPTNTGSQLQKYVVQLSSGQTATTGGSVTTSEFRNLSNGTEYRAMVCAYNKASQDPGSCSDWSQPVIPAGRPGEPTNLDADVMLARSDGRIDVTARWGDAFANGAPIDYYEVRLDGGAPIQVTGLSYTIAGAEPGHRYTIGVRAHNDVGVSGEVTTVGQAVAVPGDSTELSAQVQDRREFGNGGVALSWRAPANTGGDGVQIDHYEILREDKSVLISWVPPNKTQVTIDGLPGGQQVQYFVRAVNRVKGQLGYGNAVPFPAAIPLTGPGMPRDIRWNQVDGENSGTFSWAAAPDGGSAITQYHYTVRRWGQVIAGGDTAPGSLVTSSIDVKGPNQELTIQVWASNDVRNDGQTATYSVTPTHKSADPTPTPTPTSGSGSNGLSSTMRRPQ